MKEKPDYVDTHFVDILNTGSIIAGAAARKYLNEQGGVELMKKLHTNSSGVFIKPPKIRYKQTSGFIKLIEPYLNLAAKNKLIESAYAKKLIKGQDVEGIMRFFRNLRQKTIKDVGELLQDKSLDMYLNFGNKGEQTQAMYAKPSGLVMVGNREIKRKGYILTMSELAHERAKRINSGIAAEKRARIIKLKPFLGLSKEIPDLAFAERKMYESIVENIINAAPPALEIIISETN